jgi:hypothetical protein
MLEVPSKCFLSLEPVRDGTKESQMLSLSKPGKLTVKLISEIQDQHSGEQHVVMLHRSIVEANDKESNTAIIRCFSSLVLSKVACSEAQDCLVQDRAQPKRI